MMEDVGTKLLTTLTPSRRVQQKKSSVPSPLPLSLSCLACPARELWAELATAVSWQVTWLGQAASPFFLLPGHLLYYSLRPLTKTAQRASNAPDFEEDFSISPRTPNLRISKQSDFDKVELWIKFTKQDQIN